MTTIFFAPLPMLYALPLAAPNSKILVPPMPIIICHAVFAASAARCENWRKKTIFHYIRAWVSGFFSVAIGLQLHRALVEMLLLLSNILVLVKPQKIVCCARHCGWNMRMATESCTNGARTFPGVAISEHSTFEYTGWPKKVSHYQVIK